MIIEKEIIPKYTIPMMEKGFVVLELLSNFPDGVSMQDIIQILKQPKTTVYRLLNSLMQMGYVCKRDDSSLYFLSRKLLKIGLAALGESNIVERSLPHMQRLRDKVGETIMLGVLMEDKVVLLEQVLGSHNFTFLLRPGTTFNLHASAPGKLFVAYLKGDEQRSLMDKIQYEIFNERTIPSETVMKKEIENILSKGYSVDLEEEMDGVHCIAAPIFNQFGSIVATIWTSGPSGRVKKSIIPNIASNLMQAANNISLSLGNKKM